MGASDHAGGGMEMRRSGYLFSLIALVVAAVIVMFTIANISSLDPAATQNTDFVLSADHFLEQFEQDLSRVLYISGYRGLIGLEEHVSATGVYIEDLPTAFRDVVQNGTVNGTYYDIMDDTTLTVFESRMQQVAALRGLQFTFVLIEMDLRHASPFSIAVNATIGVNASSYDASTRWDYETSVSAVFPIQNLKDPLYTVETLGRIPVIIQESNVSSPYIDASNDTTKLQTIFNNTLYVPNELGPSLLMRFTGNLSNSPFGISSLVDTKSLDSQELPVYPTRTIVDYLYFGNSTASTHEIVNMDSQFLLDDANLITYDAVGKTTT